MAEEQNDTDRILIEALKSPGFQDRLAVANQEGNDLATNEGFGRDILEMNDLQLRAKYGNDVQNEVFRLSDGTNRLRSHQLDSSSLGEKAVDSVLDAASTLVSVSGNTVGAAAVRPMAKLFGVDEDAAAAANADLTNFISSEFRALRSDFADENSRYASIQQALDSEDNEREAQARRDAGQDGFMADLSTIGANVLDTTKNVVQDPEQLRELVAGSLGSLAPSAALARGAAVASAKGVGLLTASQRASTVAATSAAALSIGATEASGTYAETLNEVMNMKTDTLVQSPVYAGLLEEGFTPLQAKTQLANLAAEEAFARNLPAAVALGVLSSRFETAPIGSFAGAGVVGGLRTIGIQGLEEAGQGAASGLSGNLAIQGNVDASRDITEGVGEQIAQGFLGGIGQAGVTAVPATSAGAARAARDALLGGEQNFNDPLRQDILGRGNNLQEATGAVRDVVAPTAQKVSEAGKAVAGRVSETVQTYANRPSNKEVQESVQASVDATEALNAAVQTGNLPDEVASVVSQPDSDAVPEELADVAGDGRTLMENVTGIVAKLGARGTKASAAQTAYAANQFNKLRAVAKSMPPEARTQIGKILSSKMAQKVNQEATKLDLNKERSKDPATVINVAKVNPTAVNPEDVDSILEESGESISPEETKLMKVASKLASIVNRNVERQVEIRREENITLTQAQRKPEREKTVQSTSREIHAEGFVDSKGNKLRSINDFARDIITGVQSPDGSIINQKGQVIPVKTVAAEMQRLATHMNNKVAALNESLNLYRSGQTKVPVVHFDGLKNGQKFENTGVSGTGGVRYKPDNPNSVAFAQQVAQDQNDIIEAYNTLRTEFPDVFGSLPEMTPVELAAPDSQPTVVEEVSSETDEQNQETPTEIQDPTVNEKSSDALAEDATSTTETDDNPTAVETDQVSSVEEVSSEASGDTERSEVETEGAVESDETEDNGSVETETNETVLLIEDVDNWPSADRTRVLERTNELRNTVRGVVRDFYSEAVLRRVRQIRIYPDSLDLGPGYAYVEGGQQTIYLAESNFNEDGSLTREGLAVVVHETAHVLDWTNPKYTDDPGHISDRNTFQPGGAIYQEALFLPGHPSKWVKSRMKYANSYKNDDAQVHRSELFAVMTEFYFSTDASILENSPAILELMEEIHGPREREATGTTTESVETTAQESRTDGEGEVSTAPESEPDGNTGRPARQVSEQFTNNFNEKSGAPLIENVGDFLTEARANPRMNQEYLNVLETLMPEFIQKMNARLQRKVTDGKMKKTVIQHIKDGRNVFTRFKAGALVNPETEQYDAQILELASIAMMDFVATATGSDPRRLDTTLEKLGITENDVTEENMRLAMLGVPPAQVKETIANDLKRLWHVSENDDSAVNDLEGITHGFAAEMLEVLQEMEMISVEDIVIKNADGKVAKRINTLMVDTDRLAETQETVKKGNGERVSNSVRESIFKDSRETFSIGEKITSVASRQDRGDVRLSALERKALKKMQDTPHFLSVARATMLAAIGEENLAKILGMKDVANISHPILRRSVIGKNASVRKDLLEAQEVVEALGEDDTQAVYYPVGVTKVGRHQYKGPNPQSNKLLRMLITPTWSTINLESQDDLDGFWLGVAQAADLFKVEKKSHAEILDTVREDFAEEYGPAVVMMKSLLSDGDFDADAFTAEVGEVEPQILAAIEAVASLELDQEAGNSEHRTALSFELDGLTNGAANMMVNFGHGLLDAKDFNNLQRVGYFLGEVGRTVNSFFSAGNKDLYEVTSETGDKMLFANTQNLKPWQMEQRKAAGRLASAIGNFEMNEDGSFNMTRNTAKNPMTKVNYGSGVKGVADGISEDMLLTMYEKLQNFPAGGDLDVFFYPGFKKDMDTLGVNIPSQPGKDYVVPAAQATQFKTAIQFTIGEVLTNATRDVIGKRIEEVNDMMVFSTNVQSQYLQIMYDKRLDEIAEDLANKGEIGRNKNGKPNKGQIPRKYFKQLEAELSALAPLFVSDEQTLGISGFQKKTTDLRLSSSFDENLSTGALMGQPDDVGVRSIPYTVIGTGDAMMMNMIFGSDNAPEDALGIFDGLDIPVGKVKDYAPQVNEAVLQTWNRDVMAMIVQNFEGFLGAGLDADILAQAYDAVKEKSKKSSVVDVDSKGLLDTMKGRLKESQARKKVLKSLAVSVDQMGGSDVGFSRDGETLRLDEINHRIEKEMNGESITEVKDVKNPAQVTNVMAVIDNLQNLTPAQKKVIEIIRPVLSNTTVIFGTIDQLNTYRQENYADDGLVMTAPAQYDYRNDVMFMTTANNETIIHELVHAGTYTKVLDHYNGQTNEAVKRLEALMNEFLDIESQGAQMNEAQAAILRRTARNDAVNKAAAVNEFMAYVLANSQVRRVAQKTQVKNLKDIIGNAIKLMRRLMGGVPETMFDHVVFNTRVLNGPTVEEGGGNGGDNTNDQGGESTPPADNFTNYWIENLKEYLGGLDQTRDKRAIKTGKDILNARKVIDGFRQVGMLANKKDQATFKAIYGIVLSDMQLDSNAQIALTKVFTHVVENMTPEMFGNSAEARQEYSAVLNSFGEFKNGNTSDAIAVLFALSQTSKKFRNVLNQIPTAEGEAAVDGSLPDFLTRATAFTMKKLTGEIATSENPPADVLDRLAEIIIDHDQEKEFRLLKRVTDSLNAADRYVSGKFSQTAEMMRKTDREVKESTRSNAVKYLVSSVTAATNMLDTPGSSLNAEAAKKVTHMGLPILSIIPLRELVAEMVGTDRQNSEIIQMLDKVNSQISGMRQAYREDLPGIIERMFKTPPTKEEWKDMYRTFAKTDFTSLVNLGNMQRSMKLLEEGGARQAEIQRVEAELQGKLNASNFNDAKEKAQQLADYMNGIRVGKLLIRNAYAISKNLEGNVDDTVTPLIDRLTSLYAIDGMDASTRETAVRMWQDDPQAITGIVSYIQDLNEAEESKPGITEQARLNAYKGYIPNEGAKNTQLTVAPENAQADMERKGFRKLDVPYEGDNSTIFPMAYYVSTVRRQGIYSQGVMQNVAQTYRGVDVNSGLSLTNDTAGFISEGGIVEAITIDQVNETTTLINEQEALMPVFDASNEIIGYERSIAADQIDLHMGRDENLGIMMGAWAGRHVEETLALQFNQALVDKLADLWTNRDPGSDNEFTNLKTTKDKIYRESFQLIPQSTKAYMDTKFPDGVMVPTSMINLSVGYREFSLSDLWSGKTRLPKELQAAVKGITETVMGPRAMRILSTVEETGQGIVSTAKDIIVVRSLVVPFANTQANIIQLATRGVPTKQIVKQYRRKLAEVEEYNTNITKIIDLEAKIRLKARNANQKQILLDKIQVLKDLNQKMSIAPMIEAGAYKNLSEGITDVDVEISSGRIGDYMEKLSDKLPSRLGDLAKVGLVSKSTRIYKAANRATQYGDFLAKSIYYDHLLEKGLSAEAALSKMNEEFVNFSVLPGRSRSALESYGMTWFMAFKLRITKIAMQQMRENPVRALAINSITDTGSPIQDNILTVIGEGRLDYATGFEMLFDAPELNPWVNLMSD